MIDHHVAEGADRVVEVASILDTKGLGHRDLHRGDVVPVPDRLEHRVREAEEEDLLQAHLPEVMIDPQELGLVDELVQLGRESAGGLERVAERLLDHYPTAADEARFGDALDGASEEKRGNLEVEDGRGGAFDRLPDTFVGRGVREVTADVREASSKTAEDLIVKRLARGEDRRAGPLDELLDRPVVYRDADDSTREQPPAARVGRASGTSSRAPGRP